MLGSNNFAFETPNVIDAGDLPPSPPRRHSQSERQSVTAETASSSSEEHDYQEARESAARLLNDINDLDLSPVCKPTRSFPRTSRLPFRDFPNQNHNNNANTQAAAYSPYNDDPDADEEGQGHSLPSSGEEARNHAAFLLKQQHNPASPVNLGRTLKLSAPRSNGSKHLVRQRIMAVIGRAGLIALFIGTIIAVSVGLIVKATHKKHGSTNLTVNRPNFAGTDRYEEIVLFLVDAGVSSRADLTSKSSPQNAAVNWIAGTDALQYEVSEKSRLIQRYVLAVFYFGTGGASQWTHSLDFTTNTDECAWNNVVAIPDFITQEVSVGVSCNSNLQVTSIFIPSNGIKGSLPSELKHLPELVLLGLHNNELSGSLPEDLDSLSNLIYFNLNLNAFTGPIPEYLGDFPDLQVLGLMFNQFTGSVPASLGTAARLHTVAIGHNLLNGTLDFATHLSQLEYFYADHNQFTGKIDEAFFANVHELREFDVSNNQLSGVMPLDRLLHHKHNLHVLDLANNKFTGQFPDAIELNYVLHYLNLRGNAMTGQIPDTVHNLKELTHLDLQDNQLTGEIPNAIGSCVGLTYLFLGDNAFDPVLPPLSQLTQLRELSLSGLGLTGPIPSWIFFMKELNLLDLSHNSLTGVIPDDPVSLWNLPRLFVLILHDNSLSGPLPVTGGEQLILISVHNNNIEDSAFDQALCISPDDSSNNLNIVTADCNAGCSKGCCGACCQADDDACYADELAVYVNGLDYSASPFAFDPEILDEARLFESFEPAP